MWPEVVGVRKIPNYCDVIDEWFFNFFFNFRLASIVCWPTLGLLLSTASSNQLPQLLMLLLSHPGKSKSLTGFSTPRDSEYPNTEHSSYRIIWIMENCAPGSTSWTFLFPFFPLWKNYTLLFALPCSPVCKPEAVGQEIAIRAKVEEKGKMIFLLWCLQCQP